MISKKFVNRRKLIFFLVRRRFKMKIYEPFQFVGQKSNAIYFFTEDAVMKEWRGHVEKSGVSLNWLLDENCKITRVDIKEDDDNE